MKANRVEQIYIAYNSTISSMCHISKNLFNQTNYVIRQQFFNKEKQTGYKSLVKSFQKPSEIDENNNYNKLPAQTSQWTIKKVKQAWSSYYKAMKEWRKHPEEFFRNAWNTKV